MSETGLQNSGGPTSSGLYDQTGMPMQRTSNGQKRPAIQGELVRFAKEQPVTTAIGALIIGFLLAKIL
jgi:hypothetical protein